MAWVLKIIYENARENGPFSPKQFTNDTLTELNQTHNRAPHTDYTYTHAQRMMMYIVQVSITINVLRAIKKCALSTQKYLQMHTHLYTMYSVFINAFVRCAQT